MLWTDEKMHLLETHYTAGMSFRQIGELLGVSRNAVIGKIHRMGLPKRGTPRINQAAREAARLRRAQAAVARKRLQRAQCRKEPKPVEVVMDAPRTALNIPFADLEPFSKFMPNQCRFIPGDDRDFRACALETAAGESYCAECKPIVFYKSGMTQEERAVLVLKNKRRFVADMIANVVPKGEAA